MITPSALWAKLSREENGTLVGWHALVDHSADVAAVMAALLEQPTIRRRLAGAAGLADLDATVCARLAALAFLHDIGKANRGFRARIDPAAPRVGHIDEVAWLLFGTGASALFAHLCDTLGLERIDDWFSDMPEMIEAVFAHHGRPWRRGRGHGEEDPRLGKPFWERRGTSDPIADLVPLRAKLDLWFATAFAPAKETPSPPLFQHVFAGLLMLADWLGSDTQFFPLANGACADRWVWALPRARTALATVGLAVEAKRTALNAVRPDFRATFEVERPRAVQLAMEQSNANLLVLEAETGSGKTEAALWRFKLLFEQGLVDGLYFALPTRVAATQIFTRVKQFRDRVFPAGERPGVVLAVPGQAHFDGAEARPLPDFGVQWSDGEERTDARWAAERPKRFLAATIAVGTIDQALLGAVRVKHAHLRGAALLRHLLVVDEVHASDAYAGELLCGLLRSHVAAGGHALLLSATLGSALRAHLLDTTSRPDFATAQEVAYPALSWAEGGRETRHAIARDGARKAVTMAPAPLMQDAAAVAAQALAAAEAGAAVLVIRNTVGAAIDTAQAVEARAGADSPLLFRVGDVATLHHSRFAVEDRRRLDAAVEARLGKRRENGRGVVLVGSQTLEISLDIDADLLVTDLCPVDVLLQRIGRLHRHARTRPDGFAAPRVVLLTPRERDLLAISLTRYGLGPRRDGHGIYPDLRLAELTLRLAERHPRWTIPDMNRFLVEAATHGSQLDELDAEDARWQAGGDQQSGIRFGQLYEAGNARLDRTTPFTDCVIPRNEKFGTRLGADDRAVLFQPALTGPFGEKVSLVRLPGFLATEIPPDAAPAKVVENETAIRFSLGAKLFSYSRFGLLREK